MAVTSTTYTPSNDVNKAKQKVEQYQAQKPQEYQQSQQVNQAQQQLQQVQAQKPQGYNSKYGAALDTILGQIQNPEKFKYDFNGDEMFKYYADLYTQKGKQASMDAMGQAAALTGGYGNSYAQQVGNQAYDQYLMDLYAKGDQLRQEAYQRYQDEKADRYNQLNALGQADERDYGRYRDTVGDWQNERGYYTDLYNNERNFDYGKYRDTVGDWQNERGYYTDLYNNERNFDYGQFSDQRAYDEQVRQYNADMEERQRQFNESLNWDKMSTQQKYAAEYAMQILAMGQMPSEQLLQEAGLSAEDAQKLMAQLVAAEVGGGGGGGGGGRGGDKDDKGNGNDDELDPAVLAQMERNDAARYGASLDAAKAAAAAQTAQANTRNANNAYTVNAYNQAMAAAAAQTAQAQKRKAAQAAVAKNEKNGKYTR